MPTGAAWIVAASLWAAPATGQLLTNGRVSGEVTAAGSPVSGALVTLTTARGGSPRATRTSGLGIFRFDFVLPGSYELRVESVGYRPVVARTLTIEAGSVRSVSVAILPGRPPITEVDTLRLAGVANPAVSATGVRFSGEELDQLPLRSRDLAGIVALSPLFDAALGSLGLPGDMCVTYVDGVQLHRAPHPTSRSELMPHALFTTQTLSAAAALHNAADIEWSGSASGYTTLSSRSWDGARPELWAAYSGDATWQSAELDFDTPSLASFEGGARGGFAPSSGTSRVSFAADALRHQTPLSPRVDAALAADLGGLDADVLGSLTDPAVETYARYSAVARVDSEVAPTTRLFVRAGGTLAEREFEGAGPVPWAGPAAPPDRSLDWSTAAGLVTERPDGVSFEVRAGVSGSSREFLPASEATVPAFLSGTGSVLGNPEAAAGESSRTDLSLVPVVRFRPGFGIVKVGASVRSASHTMTHSTASTGELFYSDAAALLSGVGRARISTSPEASFSTRELGVFTQIDRDLGPGLEVAAGARWDYEMLPTGDASAHTTLLDATGLDNTASPTGLHQLGLRGRLRWDPTRRGRTLVSVVASLHEGDVDTRALYQLLSQDGGATDTRFALSATPWPLPGELIPPGTPLTNATLLGPDTRAPRTVTFGGGLTQSLGSALSLHLFATRRRTDFLLRRRNLNLSPTPAALDADGRAIVGDLEKTGSLITPMGASGRRFAELGDVWALDPDGWSEYKGVTVGFERSTAEWSVYASYTRSETRDNWVGAKRGVADAMLDPGLPESSDGESWSEGVSDFDVPHRVGVGTTVRAGSVTVSGVYTFRSGHPFTPGYRSGVDANGDGSERNDVAYVPGDAQLLMVLDAWPCLEDQAASFAVRNSCRGPSQHSVSLRLELGLGSRAAVVIDGLNLVEHSGGVVDDALLLVDPGAPLVTSPDGSTVTIPVSVNPGFGSVLRPSSRGRMVRIGLRVGA